MRELVAVGSPNFTLLEPCLQMRAVQVVSMSAGRAAYNPLRHVCRLLIKRRWMRLATARSHSLQACIVGSCRWIIVFTAAFGTAASYTPPPVMGTGVMVGTPSVQAHRDKQNWAGPPQPCVCISELKSDAGEQKELCTGYGTKPCPVTVVMRSQTTLFHFPHVDGSE